MRKLRRFLGLEAEHVSAAEKLVSIIGASLGIYFVILISYYSTDAQGAAYIVPSLGAAAVLLFAVPHGRLSQPWALFGGNAVSALVGVSCYKFIPEPFLAAALAVGLAIAAMHMLNCIHPPGGATALAAVIGGAGVHDLGYLFVLFPIFVNTLVLFTVALLFNSIFPWRRYPYSLMRFTSASTGNLPFIDKQSIETAIEELDVLIDTPIEELQKIFQLSMQYASSAKVSREQVDVGKYFANGRPGADWSVREIIDQTQSNNPLHDIVVYRVVEGSGLHLIDSCTRGEFIAWASREVQRNQADLVDPRS